MSLETWKEEFYPVDADCFSVDNPDIELVEHSLRKWRGLRDKNIKKHNVVHNIVVGEVYDKAEDEGYVQIGAESCALCTVYIDGVDNHDGHHESCCFCPLTDTRELPCDRGRGAPWLIYTNTGDPEPMIKALEEIHGRITSGRYFPTCICGLAEDDPPEPDPDLDQRLDAEIASAGGTSDEDEP